MEKDEEGWRNLQKADETRRKKTGFVPILCLSKLHYLNYAFFDTLIETLLFDFLVRIIAQSKEISIVGLGRAPPIHIQAHKSHQNI